MTTAAHRPPSLDRLLAEYPATSYRDEAQFRREVTAGFAAQIEPFVTGSTAEIGTQLAERV